jgi:putative PIN family toxin of toxin-antitoxin system
VRVVIDTNILVRALINRAGTVRPLLTALDAGLYTVILSAALLTELTRVLRRPRMRTKYGISEDDIRDLLQLLIRCGEIVTPARTIQVCRDPRDDMFLEAAVADGADVIVSGDEGLLVLHPFEGIPIVSPATFIALLDGPGART